MMTTFEKHIRLAVIAGIFATTGSLFGKLASSILVTDLASLMLEIILVVLMITSNTIGCGFFVKSLNASKSTLPSTIINAATSYVCSALVGCIIFGESTSICWWCGIFFVLLGLLLVADVKLKHD